LVDLVNGLAMLKRPVLDIPSSGKTQAAGRTKTGAAAPNNPGAKSHAGGDNKAVKRGLAQSICLWELSEEGRCQRGSLCRRSHDFDRASNPPAVCRLGPTCPFYNEEKGKNGCMFIHKPKGPPAGERLEELEARAGVQEILQTDCANNCCVLSSSIAKLQGEMHQLTEACRQRAAQVCVSIAAAQQTLQIVGDMLAGLCNEEVVRNEHLRTICTLQNRLAAAERRVATSVLGDEPTTQQLPGSKRARGGAGSGVS
jgi:uncharacterized coiled-coil protein SlyX